MHFGNTTYENLDLNQFALPKISQDVLSGNRSSVPKIYIALPKWGHTDWVGTLYPPKTREKEFLDHYARHFNCIELNATHYKIYSAEAIEKWINKTGEPDFLFCPKMYQGITHRGSLKGKDFISKEFFDSLPAFGNHLGPVYIQVSESFTPKRKEELFQFLKTLPAKYKYFLEVRHQDWFVSKEIKEELYQNLIQANIGLVITDTVGRRDVVHMKLTNQDAFIRFGGEGDNELDKLRILQWKIQLQKWFEKGLETCYFFLHIQNESKAIDFARYVQNELEEVINS